MYRILIAGCGYVGTALGLQLSKAGHQVWGLRRRPETIPPTIHPFSGNLTDPTSLRALPQNLDFVFFMATPDERSDTAYEAVYVIGLLHLLDVLNKQNQQLRRFFLISSTSVYGQSGGAWVDETSPTEPNHFSGIRIVEGEKLLSQAPFPSTIVRLGGIYGPTRNRLLNSVRNRMKFNFMEQPRYTNRIHRDDCAQVLQHLLQMADPAPIYLGVDNEPAAQRDVVRWLSKRLDVSLPPTEVTPTQTPKTTKSNKRCSNAKLLSAGFRFKYPTYREGYEAVLSEMGL